MAPRKKSESTEAENDTQETGAETVPAVSAAPAKKPFKGKSATSQIGAVLSSSLVQSIHKDHGKRALLIGSELLAQEERYIPTGIYSLDVALGGGWRVGGVHTLYGHKSSFKSTALFRTVGSAQQHCANCWARQDDCNCDDPREPVVAYVDVEGAVDKAWAGRFMDLSKVLLSIPEHAEQALMIGEAILRSENCDILVFDSLAFLTPSKEIENSIDKETPGIQARVIGKGVRKFTASLNDATTRLGRRPTVFFTNQIRMKLGIMFGNPETTPGGLAPGYMAWTEVKMKGGKYKLDEKEETAIYADFAFNIDKSKQGGAKSSYDFRLMLAETATKKFGDIYDEDFTLDHATRVGLVSGGGVSWHCLGRDFRKKTEIEEAFLTDPAFKQQVQDEIIRRLKK